MKNRARIFNCRKIKVWWFFVLGKDNHNGIVFTGILNSAGWESEQFIDPLTIVNVANESFTVHFNRVNPNVD